MATPGVQEIGIEFLNEEVRGILRAAGCETHPGNSNVRMGRELVMEKLALAPSRFTLTPRNPGRAVPIGGRHMAFVNVSSPPNCSDLDRGRRTGDRESYRDLLKLTQYFNCIHMTGGYPVEPVDLHPSIHRLDRLYDKLTLTDLRRTPEPARTRSTAPRAHLRHGDDEIGDNR